MKASFLITRHGDDNQKKYKELSMLTHLCFSILKYIIGKNEKKVVKFCKAQLSRTYVFILAHYDQLEIWNTKVK